MSRSDVGSKTRRPWPDRIACLVLTLFAIVSAIALLYGLWYVGDYADTTLGILLFLALPGLALLAYIALLRARPAPRAKAATALLSITAVVYGTELVLSRDSTTPERAILDRRLELAGQAGVEFDTRDLLQVVHDSRKTSDGVWPCVAPLSLTYTNPGGVRVPYLESGGEPLLPLGSVAARDVLIGNESGSFAHFRSDRHGFNNPDEVWGDSGTELAVLGDSFVQGFAIEGGRGFVSLLRRRHPSTLNLGIAGSGPLAQLAALAEYGARRRPRVLLWCYFEGNDLDDLDKEREAPCFTDYLGGEPKQRLMDRQKEVDAALEEMIEVSLQRVQAANAPRSTWSFRSLLTLRRLRGRLNLSVTRETADDGNLATFGDVLRAGNALVRSWGGRTVFVYLPDWNRFDREWTPPASRERVLELARSIGLTTVDLTTTFESQADPLALFPFRYWGHYTAEGHQLVAETLLDSGITAP